MSDLPPTIQNKKSWLQNASKHTTTFVLLATAILVASVLFWTRPSVERKIRPPRVPFVETTILKASDTTPQIEAFGSVEAVTALTIRTQVAGTIVAVHPYFRPGGTILAGETIATIDPRDYSLALQQAQAEYQIAQEEFKIEQGRQDIARTEWQRFGTTQARQEADLALRGPQLRMQQASLAAAEARLEQAKLALKRTELTLPYDISIDAIEAGIGFLAQSGTALASAHATDRFWVRAEVAANHLPWLATGPQARVDVLTQSGNLHTGYVQEILRSVASQGSLIQILIAIPISKADKTTTLHIGEFVRALIYGKPAKQVFAIPRSSFHESNRIWVLQSDSDTLQLAYKTIHPIFLGRETVLIQDKSLEGQQLITSQLSTPVEGMQLRVLSPTTNTTTQAIVQKP